MNLYIKTFWEKVVEIFMKNIYENKILKPICSKSFQRGSSQISFCGIHAIFPSPSLRFSLPITRAGLPLSGFHFSLTPYLRLSPSFSSSKSTAAPPISACCRKSRRWVGVFFLSLPLFRFFLPLSFFWYFLPHLRTGLRRFPSDVPPPLPTVIRKIVGFWGLVFQR